MMRSFDRLWLLLALLSPLCLGLPAQAATCPHRLDRLEGGPVARRPSGANAFEPVSSGTSLCSQDSLRVAAGSRVWVSCAGSLERRRIPSGVRRVGAFCDSSGVGGQRGTSWLLALPQTSNQLGDRLRLFVYLEDGSNSDASQATVQWPLVFALYEESPESATLPDAQPVYQRKLQLSAKGEVSELSTQLTDLPTLEPNRNYHWTLQRLDADETVKVSGSVSVLPTQDAQPTQPTARLGWLLERGYFNDALALVIDQRRQSPNDPTAIAQWQTVLDNLDDFSQLGSLGDRLRKAAIAERPNLDPP